LVGENVKGDRPQAQKEEGGTGVEHDNKGGGLAAKLEGKGIQPGGKR